MCIALADVSFFDCKVNAKTEGRMPSISTVLVDALSKGRWPEGR